MNGPQEIDVNKRLKIMSIVFGALLLGQLAFMVVVVTQQFTNDSPDKAASMNIIPIIATIEAVVAIAAALIIRFVFLKKLGTADTIEKAFQPYFIAMLIPVAICEGTAFFALVSIMLGGDFTWMMIVFVVLFFTQITFYPSHSRLLGAYEKAREAQKIKQLY